MSAVFHPAQRFLHWAVAAAVAAVIPLGLGIDGLSDAEVREISGGGLGLGDLYWWHKSFGFTVLFLMVLRLAARLVWGEPPHDPPLAKHERIGSFVVHRALYVLLFALPLAGWLGTSFFGPGVAVWFGLTLPDLVSQDRDMAEIALGVHGVMANLAMILIAGHLGAVAWHGWVKKDNVVERMTGGGRNS